MKKWTVGFDRVKFKVGRIKFSADVVVTMNADSNCGDDADGNRGAYQEWIDNIDIKKLRKNGKVVDIEKYSDKFAAKIDGRLTAALNKKDLKGRD